jgi:hypothetical protein
MGKSSCGPAAGRQRRLAKMHFNVPKLKETLIATKAGCL